MATEIPSLAVIQQLKHLRPTPSYKTHIEKNLKSVRFDDFVNFNGHFLELSLIPEVKIKNQSLPLPDESIPNLFEYKDTIASILEQFLSYLQDFEEFYSYIGIIDDLCFIVEPLSPSTKENWRIFKLTESVFIKIQVDPFCPSSVEMNFIGPTYEIESYRQMYNERANNWDVDLDLHKNILRIFDIFYLPMKSTDMNESCVPGSECNICMSYLSAEDGRVPIISCDNPKCDTIYHVTCLNRWFSLQTDGKTFLDVSVGKCPFCKEKLSTSFESFLS